MKKVMQSLRTPQFRRVGVAEAKAKLSEVLRTIGLAPVVIHSRGRDVGALIDIGTYERLMTPNDPGIRPGGKAFLAQVEELKRRYGGGVEDFAPPPANLRPVDPFRARRRSR